MTTGTAATEMRREGADTPEEVLRRAQRKSFLQNLALIVGPVLALSAVAAVLSLRKPPTPAPRGVAPVAMAEMAPVAPAPATAPALEATPPVAIEPVPLPAPKSTKKSGKKKGRVALSTR